MVLDPSERAEIILQEMKNQAFAQGLELINDPSLLNEVVGLIEWPVVLLGKLEDEFLALPAEVLQTSMREHQKFFQFETLRTTKSYSLQLSLIVKRLMAGQRSLLVIKKFCQLDYLTQSFLG